MFWKYIVSIFFVFSGSWVPATNKQLLMIIISPHVLIIEKAKYVFAESVSAFNSGYLDLRAIFQVILE